MDAQARMRQIQEMLQEAPGDAELHYMLAMEHVGLGQDAEAVRCFQDLVRVAPTYAPAYHQAGRALTRLGRLLEARAMLQQGIPVAQRQGNLHAAGEMQEFLDSLD